MRKIKKSDRRRFSRAHHRRGAAFMSAPRHLVAWDLLGLYGRPVRWGQHFVSRRAGERIDQNLLRLRNELLDAISLRTTPIVDHLLYGDGVTK